MTNGDHRYGDEPLGKSVEELEQESGNRVNPPVPGEQVRDDGVPLIVPPVLSGPAGTAMIPAVHDGTLVTENQEDTASETPRTTRDSSEGTI
ncbi:hypothetical protein [Deinococcus sp. YIM 77859]|uniref:hypothetical protein n=1 Tax=Deinococcus sp. YIM 77859 TaxID=1540221 RepID=UPI00054E3C2C|nr:hypothetical protein [Deinococcus sp. YIM 77859]